LPPDPFSRTHAIYCANSLNQTGTLKNIAAQCRTITQHRFASSHLTKAVLNTTRQHLYSAWSYLTSPKPDHTMLMPFIAQLN